MPPVIAAAAAFAGTTLIGSITVGSVLTTVALTAGSYLLNQALAPKQPRGFGAEEQGRKVLGRQSVPIKRMILGRSVVAGDLFFLEVKPPHLYYGIILASHEIDGVEEFRVGNVVVPIDSGTGEASSTPYNDGTNVFLEVSVRNGTDDQLIDPILDADFSELPSTFRQRGHATVVLKMRYGTTDDQHEKLWGAGDPQVSFLVRGAKVFDPRAAGQNVSDSSTWEWSDNASLCHAYWLTSPLGGNRSWDVIDQDSLAAAATVDDERIPLADGTNEARYSVNGVISLEQEPHRVLADLLTANLGRLTWSQGIYKFQPGVRRGAVWSVTDDSARGEINVRRDQAQQDLYNIVSTVFLSPERNYQLANGPEISNAAYISADGEEHRHTIQLPFTATHTRAQRIGNAVLEMSRLGKQVTREEFLGDGILLSAGDIINVESSAVPLMQGQYEVAEAGLDPSGSVKVTYEQYDPSVFDWDISQEQAFTISPAELAGVN